MAFLYISFLAFARWTQVNESWFIRNFHSSDFVCVSSRQHALRKLKHEKKCSSKWKFKMLKMLKMNVQLSRFPTKFYLLCMIRLKSKLKIQIYNIEYRKLETNTFVNLRHIHFDISNKYLMQFETNTFCNLTQVNFAIWDKYILQFETNIFGNLWQMYFASTSEKADPANLT